MKLNIARVAALGPIGIGILFTALGNGACAVGSGAPGSSESLGKVSQPTITPVSLNTDGACGAVGTFAITSPQVIQFIAANASKFQNAQFQLFVQTQTGKTTTVASTSQTASAAFSSMLNASTTSTAAQAASAQQSASAFASNSAITSATATEMDQTQVMGSATAFATATEMDQTTVMGSATAFATSVSSVFHHDVHHASASGTADNTAITSATASNSASGLNTAANSANSNFLTTAFQQSTVPAFFGGIGLLPVFTSSSANQVNSAAASNSAFFNNMAQAAQAASAVNTSSFQNQSESDNTTNDVTSQMTNSGSAFDQTIQHQLNAGNATLAANQSLNQSNSSAQQGSSASQFANNNLTQSGSNSSSSATQVFNDLDTMNSNTFVLVANLTATQQSTILQLFQGSDNVVTGDGSFPIVIPTCN